MDKAEIIGEKLQVLFYFYVIKSDRINELGIEVEYKNDSIGVISFMSGGEFDNFRDSLIKMGLERGIDFVDGLDDGLTGLVYYPNDWLKFEENNNKHFVSYVKNN